MWIADAARERRQRRDCLLNIGRTGHGCVGRHGFDGYPVTRSGNPLQIPNSLKVDQVGRLRQPQFQGW